MPKIGTDIAPTAAEVWAASARTLTDISAEEIFDLPISDDLYANTNVNSASPADTYGSWSEISPDIGVGKRLLWLSIRNNSNETLDNCEIEIGEGASGSEVAVARIIASFSSWSSASFMVWKALTNNARISVRIKDEEESATNMKISVMVA